MRVFIYGPPGAGKTTLALALHRRFGWPVTHLDEIFFRSDGTAIELEKSTRDIRAVLREQSWIVEGNHGSVLQDCAERAERIVILRLGRWRSLSRVVGRRLERQPALEDRGPGSGRALLALHQLFYVLFVHPRLEPLHLAKIEQVAPGRVRVFRSIACAETWFDDDSKQWAYWPRIVPRS